MASSPCPHCPPPPHSNPPPRTTPSPQPILCLHPSHPNCVTVHPAEEIACNITADQETPSLLLNNRKKGEKEERGLRDTNRDRETAKERERGQDRVGRSHSRCFRWNNFGVVSFIFNKASTPQGGAWGYILEDGCGGNSSSISE